jgi:hypothetical protein
MQEIYTPSKTYPDEFLSVTPDLGRLLPTLYQLEGLYIAYDASIVDHGNHILSLCPKAARKTSSTAFGRFFHTRCKRPHCPIKDPNTNTFSYSSLSPFSFLLSPFSFHLRHKY